MKLLLALALLCPARAAEIAAPAVPAAPRVTRLVLEAVPDARGFSMIRTEQEKQVQQALEASGGLARLITHDGASSIFASIAFVEAQPAAVAQIKAAAQAAGLKVSSLEQATQAFAQAAPSALPQSDAELKAAADRMMDGTRAFAERSADVGAFVAAVNAAPGALSGLSEETRRQAVRALHHHLFAVTNAHGAIRGDQRIAARQEWLDAHPGRRDWKAMEEHARQVIAAPEKRAPAEPLRDTVKAAARAVQALAADNSVPLLVDLLPTAEDALHEDLVSRPAAAEALARGWLAMLERAVVQTRDLMLDQATASPERAKEIRLTMHSGGIASMDTPKVDGHRTAYWGYDVKDYFYGLADLHHYIWSLVGSSPEVAAAIKAGLPALIARAGPVIEETNAIARAAELAKIEAEMAANEARAVADGFTRKEDVASMRQLFTEHRMKQWDEHDAIEGNEILDRALRSVSWYSDRDRLKPSFDEDLYVSTVASLLRAAAASSHLNMFKLVAQVSLRFSEEVRQSAWGRILGATKDELDALDKEVRARAASDGLKLY